jgi:hypothetical protein
MSIEDLINNVVDQDFAKAGPTFQELMQDRMNDALEQEKIAVAGQIFNGEEPEEEEEVEMEAETDDIDVDDVTDEEIEDAIDELELEEVE